MRRAELEAEQQRGDFAIGFAQEYGLRMLGHELRLQLSEVLDDAVVDEGEFAVVTQVRMRVLIVGSTVSGPAGVADSSRAIRDRTELEIVDEDLQLARPLAGVQISGCVDNGDPRGVVTPVLEPTKAPEKNFDASVCSDVAHDSAHGTRVYRGLVAKPVEAHGTVAEPVEACRR